MTFDPKKHLIRIQGNREYLPVAARLIWFRQEHPDWGIVTHPVEINLERQYVIFSCQIFNAEGKVMATATKMENVRGFPDYLEKAETGSVGRALAMCGYGTQFAPEFDEGDRLADAPMAQSYAAPRSAPTGVRGAAPRPAASGMSVSTGTSGITRVREPERPAMDPSGEDDDEDPFGEEPVDGEAPANGTAPTPKENLLAGNRCSVDGCSNVLTAGQMTMAMNKFGRPLCLLHQKDAQPVAGAGASANGRRGE